MVGKVLQCDNVIEWDNSILSTMNLVTDAEGVHLNVFLPSSLDDLKEFE